MSWFVGTQVPFFWVGFKNDFLFKRSAVTFKVCSLISWWSPFPVTTEVMSLGIWSRVFYTLSPINTLTAASECDDKWWLLTPTFSLFFPGCFFFSSCASSVWAPCNCITILHRHYLQLSVPFACNTIHLHALCNGLLVPNLDTQALDTSNI